MFDLLYQVNNVYSFLNYFYLFVGMSFVFLFVLPLDLVINFRLVFSSILLLFGFLWQTLSFKCGICVYLFLQVTYFMQKQPIQLSGYYPYFDCINFYYFFKSISIINEHNPFSSLIWLFLFANLIFQRKSFENKKMKRIMDYSS